jgi:hypothetical protein
LPGCGGLAWLDPWFRLSAASAFGWYAIARSAATLPGLHGAACLLGVLVLLPAVLITGISTVFALVLPAGVVMQAVTVVLNAL